jgi:hypothetical protein
MVSVSSWRRTGMAMIGIGIGANWRGVEGRRGEDGDPSETGDAINGI